ncbi:MAG: hypothetical protein WA624_11645 [Methylocella sp.]
METYFLDLAFRGHATGIGPSAAVRTKNASSSEQRYDKPNLTLITHECASYVELDEGIDKLIAELESIRQKGKRMFESSLREFREKH